MTDTPIDENRRLLIVVINWHQEDETLPCRRQLRAQAPSGTSILLVDNEGDQRTAATFDAHAELFDHYQGFEENLGFTGACNFGLEFARVNGYAFVLWYNNDAELGDGCLPRLLEELEADPQLAMVSPVLRDVGTGAAHFCGARLDRSLPGVIYYALNEVEGGSPNDCLLYGTALMARTEHAHRVGGFREKYFIYFEDMELSTKWIYNGYKCKIVPDVSVMHNNQRAGEADTVRSKYYYYMTRNEIDFWRKTTLGLARVKALLWHLNRSLTRMKQLKNRGHADEAAAIRHGLTDGVMGNFGRWNHHPAADS